MTDQFKPSTPRGAKEFEGPRAVIGMDIKSYSKLEHADQLDAVRTLHKWIQEATSGQGLATSDWRWNSGGDGGYLTCTTIAGSQEALEVAFAILRKTRQPGWVSRNGQRLELRMAVHAGVVQEAHEFGQATNVWGTGINETARILDLAQPSQVLVSRTFLQHFVTDPKRQEQYQFGEEYTRTAKHQVELHIRNVCGGGVGLPTAEARCTQWAAIGQVWQRVVDEYTLLFHDAINSKAVFPALAIAKFLLDLDQRAAAERLLAPLFQEPRVFPHWLFAAMTAPMLVEVLDATVARWLPAGSTLCVAGEPAHSCYLPISGQLAVEVPGDPVPKSVRDGDLVGEFGLWVPDCTRTATIRAVSDAFLLELTYEQFRRTLRTAEAIYHRVTDRIRDKIIDSICSSPALFPFAHDPAGRRERVRQRASCDLFLAGCEFDLESGVYFLFGGSVTLTHPAVGGPITLHGHTDFRQVQVVGVRSDTHEPVDGPTARVERPSVAMHVPASVVDALLHEDDHLSSRWAELWAVRSRLLKKAPARSTQPAEPSH